MHKEILSEKQKDILPLIGSFSDNFGLVGGTAIALLIGHRESIDFDLFTEKELNNLEITKKIRKQKNIEHVIVDSKEEFTVIVEGVKITFLNYPYTINYSKKLEDIISLPDILTLGAMKAYALGRRAKWKDYVDLYFITKEYGGVKEVIEKAKEIFKNDFNEKIFRAQLSYFEDIDFSEEVIYRENFKIDDEVVKNWLKKISVL